ncbi:MAG: alpha/beta hydrolase [Gammaproteobacteria bacterium]|nr:alpha/beta hydrolase [Gammaproteobacteria bacterium]
MPQRRLAAWVMWAAGALAVAAAAYAAFGVGLYVNQRRMMYFPTVETPAALVPGAPVEWLPVAAGDTVADAGAGESTPAARLKIWRIGAPDAAQAVLYFGGNAEDVSWNVPAFAAAFPGRAVYLPNYRGYGGSGGAPSQAALFADALALYDRARARHDTVALVGRSLGSAVAAHVAAERAAAKLALITPFDSALNVARGMFPLFPVALLLKDRYDTASRVADIKAPVLVVIAGRDRVIPRRRSEALARAFPAAQVQVREFPAANHHDISEAAGYAPALAGFIGGGGTVTVDSGGTVVDTVDPGDSAAAD